MTHRPRIIPVKVTHSGEPGLMRRWFVTVRELTGTLNLPKTTFPQRADYAVVEERYTNVVSTELYQTQVSIRIGLTLIVQDEKTDLYNP
jgi:hypothetical protein